MDFLGHFPLLPVILLVALSGFFSAAETSLFSLSRFQLRQIKGRSPAIFEKLQFLLDRPAALVATVLIGNECANVLISHFLADFFEKTFHGQLLLVTLVNLATVTPIIFIFGEITPKVLAARANLTLTPIILPVLWFAYKVSFPIRWGIESIVNLLTIKIRRNSSGADRSIREEDFLHLVEDIKNKGGIEKSEQELIENVFDHDDDNALELSTPLSEFMTVVEGERIDSVIQKLKRSYAPRIAVLSAPDRIAGILYAKDLLKYLDRDESEQTVRQLMKDPLIVEPQMKIEALFKRLRQMKVHIAVIEDNHGKALGVVTMDDILEQMFGEIWERAK